MFFVWNSKRICNHLLVQNGMEKIEITNSCEESDLSFDTSFKL